MTRFEKIRAFLLEHGSQDAAFDWNSQNFEEAHFHDKGTLIIVRVHRNMQDLIEVFRVENFFCAGQNRSEWNEKPEMDHVLKWLGEMLEHKPLT